MKNTLILASFLALAPLAKGQLLLEALDAPEAIVLPTLPNGITISNGQHFIASIYDTDYLPYQVPTSTAVWTTVSADNQPEGKVIDYQGIVPATGINVQIPITATGNATLPAFTSSEIAIDPQGEEGVANSNRKVVLSWAQQNITSSTKFITAVIKPSNNLEIKVKKLDLNGGLGNDYKGTLLANFSLPKSNLNTTEKVGYELRVLSGIPDKHFNTQIGGQYRHKFIYLPIQGPDGKLWLNNNLGADYANINSPHFSPVKQAETPQDYKAYGSLFQFGRDGDGHELVNRTSFFDVTRAYPTAVLYSNNSGLLSYTREKDPCPQGWHTPSSQEFLDLQSAIVGTSTSLHIHTNSGAVKADDTMKFTTNGKYDFAGIYEDMMGDNGVLWSSSGSVTPYTAYYLTYKLRNSRVDNSYNRSDTYGVRCIQD